MISSCCRARWRRNFASTLTLTKEFVVLFSANRVKSLLISSNSTWRMLSSRRGMKRMKEMVQMLSLRTRTRTQRIMTTSSTSSVSSANTRQSSQCSSTTLSLSISPSFRVACSTTSATSPRTSCLCAVSSTRRFSWRYWKSSNKLAKCNQSRNKCTSSICPTTASLPGCLIGASKWTTTRLRHSSS